MNLPSRSVLDAKWLDPECCADGCQSLKYKLPVCRDGFPEIDGYYWMHNMAGPANEIEIWRVVYVYNRPQYGEMQRVAKDGHVFVTDADLKHWSHVEFHGPLLRPVERKMSEA